MVTDKKNTENNAAETAAGIDRKLVEAAVTLLEIPYKHYFNVTVGGTENLPAEGPALLVGNHGGAINSPDMLMLFAAWYRHQGFDRPLHALAHDFFFRVPLLSDALRGFGAMPANPEAAAEIFRGKGFLLVYPGGDRDAFKPFGTRNRIRFYGRRGFIKLAIRNRVPIIPVCARGGHDTLFVITSGRPFAKALGLDRLFRLDLLPISWSFPWGLTAGPFLPYIPLPVHIRLRFCPPMPFGEFRPEDADDPAAIEYCHDRIVEVMQKTHDSMSDRKKRRP